MHALALSLLLLAQPAPIQRDSFGVPLVTAPNEAEAFYHFGRAVAQDRLWQMEMSRRLARGRMAEVMGPSALASDRSVAKTGYTDEEVQRQVDAMPLRLRTLFNEYARGINDEVTARKAAGTLPAGYAENGFEPEPWTPLDSAAIAINLLRQFGRGGAGEVRNYALLLYLRSQPCKDKLYDVLDDLAWQNDPDAVPTIRPEDDPLRTGHPDFGTLTRQITERHVGQLPPTNILELLPAIQLAEGQATDLIAEKVGAPWKWGSYAIVVSPKRSKTGNALLLSAPQMGHSDPSVIHEVALDCPTLKVAGIDVPGVPAVVIGTTPRFAWGLTSGVADIEDVFFSLLVDEDTYQYGSEQRKLTKIARTIQVKGGDPVTVEVVRTHYGPVLLNSRVGKCVYSVQSSFWGREMSGIAALFDLYSAESPGEIGAAIGKVPVTFNFFYATTKGETGYRYAGLVPQRAKGFDPRFPLPGTPATAWQGFIAASQMPHVENPELLTNWNNKPVSWWPNLDTPVWGSPFRNEVLINAIPTGKLDRNDLEHAAWEIARRETSSNGAFIGDFRAVLDARARLGGNDPLVKYLGAYDGWDVEGSVGALLYDETVKELREELFTASTGTFLQPAIFEQVLQPGVMHKALRGQTKYDYLNGRKGIDVVTKAMDQALSNLKAQLGDDPSVWSFRPGSIAVRGQRAIPYNNRGTYIQIVELASLPVGRSVASPGVAESGAHTADQADLARAWTYKPMWRIKPD